MAAVASMRAVEPEGRDSQSYASVEASQCNQTAVVVGVGRLVCFVGAIVADVDIEPTWPPLDI